MKLSIAAMALSLSSLTQAIDFKDYAPAAGVDAGFKSYLEELYATAEDTKATTTFTNFFKPPGLLIVLTNRAEGSDQIVALKQKLLPPNGNKRWNHVPNDVSVDAETPEYKRFLVLGKIQTTLDGQCSQATYKTRFTIAKTEGKLSFAPHSGNLVSYDDFDVTPPKVPTGIPCDP